MSKIRYGIVGVGNQGTYYAVRLDGGLVEDSVLTAVADINPAKIEAIKPKLKGDVKYYSDYKQMLTDGVCDAVLVAVPHYDHPSIVIECLNRGIHVITDKPAAVYTKQVEEMNAAAEKSKALYGMMFNQRTNCLYRKMKEIIAAGGIGHVLTFLKGLGYGFLQKHMVAKLNGLHARAIVLILGSAQDNDISRHGAGEEVVVVYETVLHGHTELVAHRVATDGIGFNDCYETHFVRMKCRIVHVSAHPIAGSDSNYRSRHRVMPITVLSFYHYFLDFPFLAPCLLRSRMRMLRNMTPGPWPQKLM